MPRIDAHAHLFAADSSEYPRAVDTLAPAERSAEASVLLRAMDSAGVDSLVAVALGIEDAYLRACLDDHPDRFHPVLVSDPSVTDPGAVAHRLDSLDAIGLRFFGLDDVIGDDGETEGARYWPIIQRLATDGRALWLYLRPGDEKRVEALARRCADLPIVLNHCGFPQASVSVDEYGRPHLDAATSGRASELANLASFPNISVIFSGQYAFSSNLYPYLDLREEVLQIVDLFGTDHLMCGSDFPWIEIEPGYSETLNLVDQYMPNLSVSERSDLLGENVQRLITRVTRS